MEKTFQNSNIKNLLFKNRILRSATHEGMGDQDGRPKKELEELYVCLAKGGVGGIITGIVGVQENGRALKNMNMITDDFIADYKRMTDRVHEHGVPIIMQLVHAGRQTNRETIHGERPMAPSAIRDKMYYRSKPKKMNHDEIYEVINNFATAIERAKKAGFDGIQLHCAHGFLLSQFLSPHMNRRKDRWGGNIKNRFRIIAEIIRAAKKRTGDFPILVKINGYDHRPKGMRVDQAVKISQLLEQEGCDGIEVSCGVMEDGFCTIRTDHIPVDLVMETALNIKRVNHRVKWLIAPLVNIFIKKRAPVYSYNVSAARQIKKSVTIPVIAVGGIRDLEGIKEIINSNGADYVSMARPFIIEPDIVNKFSTGLSTSSKCISCAFCFLKSQDSSLRCYHKNIVKKSGEQDLRKIRSDKKSVYS